MSWFLLAQQAAASDPLQSWLTAGLLMTLLAIFAADKVIGHLKNRGIDLRQMHRWLEDLHEWHDHDDPDQAGVKIWWNQKYMADMIKDAIKTQHELVTVIREMRQEQVQQAKVDEKQIDLLEQILKQQEKLLRKLDE